MINLLIGLLVGVISTLLNIGYVFGLVEQEKIKKDIVVTDLIAENKRFRDWHERNNRISNEDYWG